MLVLVKVDESLGVESFDLFYGSHVRGIHVVVVAPKSLRALLNPVEVPDGFGPSESRGNWGAPAIPPGCVRPSRGDLTGSGSRDGFMVGAS